MSRVALVTGASRGIGAAVARELGRRGHRVAITARSAGALAAVAGEVPGGALAIPADLASDTDVVAMVDTVRHRLGPVEVLVSNAAVLEPIAPLWDADPVAWQRAVDVNIVGAWRVLRAVLPGMIERRWGRVVAVSSSSARQAFPGLSAYCASKAGFEHLHAVAARECDASGTVVNIVWPGGVDTGMQALLRTDAFPAADRARAASHAGLLRSPDAVAPSIADLCADGVTVNGTLVDLDEVLGSGELMPTTTRGRG